MKIFKARKLVYAMLEKNPDNRISLTNILTHRFIIKHYADENKSEKNKETYTGMILEENKSQTSLSTNKNNEKSMEESQKNRNELTFMEKQESSKKKPKNKHKESDSDDIGNEVSEEETSRRNTALQRNMDESINRSKSQERQKIAPGKMGKEDWMNPEENSLDDDMDNYFKKLEDDKNKKAELLVL